MATQNSWNGHGHGHQQKKPHPNQIKLIWLVERRREVILGCIGSLGRSVRSCSQTIPEALAKIWRAAGSKVRAFSYMVRKLRSIAFQRCIWRGGLPLVEMAENEDFLQKKAWKTGFLRDTNRDQLTLERAGAQNFKNNATLDIFHEKYGP